MMADSPLPPDGYHYEPPAALWELVEKNVPPHERQEIRKMLGESLVEQSLELHQEVNTLLEIWREYREETEAIFTKHRLPEPPAARERLKQEIKFFVQSIKEKAKDTGRDADEVLEKHKSNVIDYALDTERSPSSGYHSRPSTALSSRDGRDTPMRCRTPMTDRALSVTTLSDEVDAINDKLTYLQFDEVVQHLRETLEDEVTQLTRDIEFLQGCLDDEADFRGLTGPSREPTLTELREERSKLEKELLTSVTKVPKALRESNLSNAKIKSVQSSIIPSAIKEINHSGVSGRTRPVKVKPSHQISPTGPVKANYQLYSSDLKTRTSVSPAGPMKACHPITSQSQNISKDTSSRLTYQSREVKQVRLVSAKNSTYNVEIPDTAAEHISIKTSKISPNAHVVSIKTETGPLIPSPPSSAKPNSSRPGSANKFRRMVMECRDGQ